MSFAARGRSHLSRNEPRTTLLRLLSRAYSSADGSAGCRRRGCEVLVHGYLYSTSNCILPWTPAFTSTSMSSAAFALIAAPTSFSTTNFTLLAPFFRPASMMRSGASACFSGEPQRAMSASHRRPSPASGGGTGSIPTCPQGMTRRPSVQQRSRGQTARSRPCHPCSYGTTPAWAPSTPLPLEASQLASDASSPRARLGSSRSSGACRSRTRHAYCGRSSARCAPPSPA